MNTSKRHFRFSAVSLSATSVLWAMSASTPIAQAQLAVTDLGNLGGTASDPASIAIGINNSNTVVGTSYLADNTTQHAFVYSGNGPMTDLTPVIGGSNSSAEAVNNLGTIVGFTDNVGFVDSGGVVTTIGPLPGGPYNGTFATAINNLGEVAGESYTFTGGQYRPYEAITWTSTGGIKDIGNLGGNSQALGINDAGLVVGDSDTSDGGQRAFLYDGTTMHDLGTIAGSDGKYSFASAINTAGLITGASDAPGDAQTDYDAFLYAGGVMNDLGNLGGGYSEGLGINDLGQVVGDSYTTGGADHAFIYQDGVMTDLNSLIDPTSGWVLTAAYGINDSGEIVGYGTNPAGQLDAFEISVPEPGSIGILAVGTAALLKRRGRSHR